MIRGRNLVLGGLAWVTAVVGVAVLAWAAINSAGTELGQARTVLASPDAQPASGVVVSGGDPQRPASGGGALVASSPSNGKAGTSGSTGSTAGGSRPGGRTTLSGSPGTAGGPAVVNSASTGANGSTGSNGSTAPGTAGAGGSSGGAATGAPGDDGRGTAGASATPGGSGGGTGGGTGHPGGGGSSGPPSGSAGASGSPSASASASPSAPVTPQNQAAPSPTPTPVDHPDGHPAQGRGASVTTDGGSVVATCLVDTITDWSVTPSDGWATASAVVGPTSVVTGFSSPTTTISVHIECRDGAPVFDTQRTTTASLAASSPSQS